MGVIRIHRLRVVASLVCLVGFAPSRAAAQDVRELPAGKPVNQLCISGNACGPAALMNSLRSSREPWRQVAERLPGEGDRGQLRYLIRAHGMRPSESLRGRPRWSRNGINVTDLTVMANEVCASGYFLKWRNDFPGAGERDLRRLHQRVERSLKHGLPPVISLRRLVQRKVAGRAMWLPLDGHYVTVLSVPKSLPRGAAAFPVRYIDPWGGKIRTGFIRCETPSSGCGLIAEFPQAEVGKSKVRKGEASVLSCAAVLGTW